MKNLNKIKSLSSLAIFAIIIASNLIILSCKENEELIFEDIEKTGGFVRFANENPKKAVGVNSISDLVYKFTVEDVNNNVALYTLDVYADLSGTRTDTLHIAKTNVFPKTFSFTAEVLAEALNINVNNISFGDKFYFTATVTTREGKVYSGTEPLNFDDLNDEDTSTFILQGQGITEDLLIESGYRQAFEFDFIVLCPPTAGIYTIDMQDSWGDGWQTNDPDAGDGIKITIDDQIIEIGICSPYNNSQADFCTPGDGLTASTTVEIPAGSEIVSWEFPGDGYVEISFQIYDPEGNLVGDYTPGTPAGLLVLCDSDLGT